MPSPEAIRRFAVNQTQASFRLEGRVVSPEDCPDCECWKIVAWGTEDERKFYRYCTEHKPDPTPREMLQEADRLWRERHQNLITPI